MKTWKTNLLLCLIALLCVSAPHVIAQLYDEVSLGHVTVEASEPVELDVSSGLSILNKLKLCRNGTTISLTDAALQSTEEALRASCLNYLQILQTAIPELPLTGWEWDTASYTPTLLLDPSTPRQSLPLCDIMLCGGPYEIYFMVDDETGTVLQMLLVNHGFEMPDLKSDDLFEEEVWQERLGTLAEQLALYYGASLDKVNTRTSGEETLAHLDLTLIAGEEQVKLPIDIMRSTFQMSINLSY